MLTAVLLVGAGSEAGLAHRARSEQPLNLYISNDDFPAASLQRGAEGTVGFELKIGADGRLEDCTVTSSANDVDLDRVTCQIMWARARFVAARDEGGEAVADTMSARVTWRINPNSGVTPGPYMSIATIRAMSDGSFRCMVSRNRAPVAPYDCQEAQQSGVLELLIRVGGRGELTQVFGVTPKSELLPEVGASDFGTAIYLSEAEVDVAGSGRIDACRTTRQDVLNAPVEGFRAPDICSVYGPELGMAFRPNQDRQAQTVLLSSSLYIRELADE